MLSDLRLALRRLRARPAYALAVVLCLALGIGINATVYSMVDAVVLRPFPYADPERLVALEQVRSRDGARSDDVSVPDVVDYREGAARALSGVAAYAVHMVNLSHEDQPEGMDALRVSATFFDVLGVRPALGRGFRAEESRGMHPVVVIGHDLWQQRFQGDPRALGQTLLVDGVPHTVIGVMPEGFSFTTDIEQLWLPLDETVARRRDARDWHAVARLADGVPPARASEEIGAISRRLAELHPETNAAWRARLVPLRESLLPTEVRAAMLAMLGAVTFVLLIACANVANLMLGRTAARQRELAIRAALGAGAGRIARQLLTESVLLALLGGALGVLLAVWGLQATLAAIPYPFPGWMEVRVNWRVIWYTLGISVASGLAFGLVPALHAMRAAPAGALSDGGRGSAGPARGRARDLLVGAQLALSVVLLAGAVLMMTSFVRLQRVDPGFDTRPLLVAQLYAGAERHDDPARRATLWDAVLREVRALPGVERAGLVSYAPLSGWNSASVLQVEGQTFPSDARPGADTRAIAGDYFPALGIAPIAGRLLTTEESLDPASTVVVINRTMAERFWPGESPLGRRVSLGADGEPRWLTVVGVVPDVKLRSLDRPINNQIYLPYAGLAPRRMSVVLRASGDPAALAGALRRAVTAADPAVPVLEVITMERMVHRSLWQQRVFGGLFSCFAAAALLLAAIGLYGVVAYATQQRTREIGVRIALGARREDVYRLVLGRGAVLVGSSLATGLVLALGATRALSSQLYGVAPNDPLLLGGVLAALAVVAALASWLPARRATRVDPVVALRAE